MGRLRGGVLGLYKCTEHSGMRISKVGRKEQNQESTTISQYKGTESLRALRTISVMTSGFLISLMLIQIVLCFVYAFIHPLSRAIEWGDIRGVEKLMAKGYDPNSKIGSKTALTYTISDCLHTPAGFIRHKDQADLKQKIDANVKKMTDILEVLISNGAQINELDDDGKAILHYAISRFIYWEARPDVVQWLLERGANPNLKNSRGETPLRLAVKNDNEQIAKLLREQGAKE